VTPLSLETMVQRQHLRWEAARKASAQRAPHEHGLVAPTVAISRLPHAGGAALAQRLAETLDYGLFGRELLDEIERREGVQRSLLAGLDERIHGAIERYVLDTVRRDSFTESHYLVHLVRTLRTLSERGMVIVLGRGAGHILPPERTLRVLVVAPRRFRLERLARTRKLSEAEAEAALISEDGQRRDFLRHHFGIVADDPLDYDLVLNTGAIGLDAAARIVVEALWDRFPGARRHAG
jgi:cytidylate kinase